MNQCSRKRCYHLSLEVVLPFPDTTSLNLILCALAREAFLRQKLADVVIFENVIMGVVVAVDVEYHSFFNEVTECEMTLLHATNLKDVPIQDWINEAEVNLLLVLFIPMPCSHHSY